MQSDQTVVRAAEQDRGGTNARALTLLAGAAVLSALVYWLAFSRAYSLLDLYNQPVFDLRRRARAVPAARWWLLAAFLVQSGWYWLGLRAARRARGPAAWPIVLMGALVSAAILLFMFPFGAADIFDYIMHGRILGVYDANPFVQVGSNFPRDPFCPYMAWRDQPSTYGPLWTMLGGVVARLAGDGVVANVLAFKLLAGVFFFAGVGVIADTLRRIAPERALAGVVTLAWNPIVLYETFGNGHNDMAMIFWVLAAAGLIARRRYTLAILALVVGGLFKYIPILLLPAAGLIALRGLPGMWARLRFVLIAGLAAVLLIELAYLPFWNGLETLAFVRRRDLYTTSLPAFLYAWLQVPWGAERARFILGTATAMLTVAFALWQGVRAWCDCSWLSFPRAAFWIALFYLLFTCLWFQEWYTVWPAALAALMLSDRAMWLSASLNLAGVTKPLIFAPLWLWLDPLPPGPWRELRLGPAVLALPWLALLWYLVTYKRPRRANVRVQHDR
jgi:hypothetical protein